MAATAGEEVSNRRVILKRYVRGFPTEDDMQLVTATVRLAVPPGSAAVMLKNLYVSCDPYMRSRMTRHEEPIYYPDFVPGEKLEVVKIQRIKRDQDRGGEKTKSSGPSNEKALSELKTAVKLRKEADHYTSATLLVMVAKKMKISRARSRTSSWLPVGMS